MASRTGASPGLPNFCVALAQEDYMSGQGPAIDQFKQN